MSRFMLRKIVFLKDKLLAATSKLADFPEIQEEVKRTDDELVKQTAILTVLLEAVEDELTDCQSAMDGFLEILDKLGEQELCAQRVEALLVPLHRQAHDACEALNLAVIG